MVILTIKAMLILIILTLILSFLDNKTAIANYLKELKITIK
jgi:hypothetical protein